MRNLDTDFAFVVRVHCASRQGAMHSIGSNARSPRARHAQTSTPTSCWKPASSLAASATSRSCARFRSRFAAVSIFRSSVRTGRARPRCLKAFDRMMIGEISGELDICAHALAGVEAIGPGQVGGVRAPGRQPRAAVYGRAVPVDVPLPLHEPVRYGPHERPQGGPRGDGGHRHDGVRPTAARHVEQRRAAEGLYRRGLGPGRISGCWTNRRRSSTTITRPTSCRWWRWRTRSSTSRWWP